MCMERKFPCNLLAPGFWGSARRKRCRAKVCLPQTAINSYYVGRDGNDWWPGHFRVHVPGNQRVKLVKLRLISWLFAPLLMC